MLKISLYNLTEFAVTLGSIHTFLNEPIYTLLYLTKHGIAMWDIDPFETLDTSVNMYQTLFMPIQLFLLTKNVIVQQKWRPEM